MIKKLEVISLIYKSVSYLDSICNEFDKPYCKVDGVDIKFRVVANDANKAVLDKLSEGRVPYSIYNDEKPNDYYLNRVYRCWNSAGISSECDYICFVNSDMIFSKDWLVNLIKHYDGVNIPCSRLIESGKMPSGLHGMGWNFGRHPNNFLYELWNEHSDRLKEDVVKDGGLYMPFIINKQRFIESGMYPEGNIYSDGRAGSMNGQVVKSGDDYYFHDILEKKFGMKHKTVFDSIVYHFQEGEMDE